MDQDSADILLSVEYWDNLSRLETRDRKPIIVLAVQTVLLVSISLFGLHFNQFHFNQFHFYQFKHLSLYISRSSGFIYNIHICF